MPGSELAITVRRNAVEANWFDKAPKQTPSNAYGVGWTCNLACYFEYAEGQEQVSIPDDQGGRSQFVVRHRNNDMSQPAEFFAMPSSSTERSVYLDKLKLMGSTMVMERKYGTKYTYAQTPTPSGNSYVWRLKWIEDKFGTRIVYSYISNTALIPKRIYVEGRASLKVDIESSDNLIRAVTDSAGNRTSYTYTVNSIHEANLLTRVTNADSSSTQYTYDLESQDDPNATEDDPNPCWHCNLKTVQDALGRNWTFSYDMDESKKFYLNPNEEGKIMPAQPRCVKRIDLPGNNGAAVFENLSEERYKPWAGPASVDGYHRTRVTDADGHSRTYEWSNVVCSVKTPESGESPKAVIAFYPTLTITFPDGKTEKYEFNLKAGMALKSSRDIDGNVTQFSYMDPWTPPSPIYDDIFEERIYGFYDDVTSQTNAAGKTKRFTYTNSRRLLKSVEDELGRLTEYEFDSQGRRIKESLRESSGSGSASETTLVYGTPYGEFLSSQTITSMGVSFTTTYTPDSKGRVQSTTTGLSTTSYTYDKNGNKTQVTDPNGNITQFRYDNMDRLIRVINPDNSVRIMTYDAVGNKLTERDENGRTTTWEYDELDRVVKETRPGNLTTQYTYSKTGLKLTATDPMGRITRMEYDDYYRLVRTLDPLNQATELTYGENSGSTLFDVSGYKPTAIRDARGFVTSTIYDVLHRPTSTTIDYGGAVAVTLTQYDDVGNVTSSTDSLGRITRVEYDIFNKPRKTFLPGGGVRQSIYLAGGQIKQELDESGGLTITDYDASARPFRVKRPDGVDIITEYDHNGNVTAVEDGRGKRTTSTYSNRNRKLTVTTPNGTGGTATVSSTYDAAGNVLTMTDPKGQVTTNTYDVSYRLIST
ncbi:MAG: hypothetical protein ACAI35_09075, partial [Candidatus Methylacidiphilales bacterium]